MSLQQSEIRTIARLARLAVSEEQIPEYQQALGNILGLVEQMQAVNTDGVEPMAHAVDVVQRLRPDVATEIDRREAFQAIAPDVEAGLYLVPKVIE